MITFYYYCRTFRAAVANVTGNKMQLPVSTGRDMDVVNDINVRAVNPEFLQQRLHPAKRITH